MGTTEKEKDVVVFVRDGTYEGDARVVLEKRNGKYVYVWHGFYNGGNVIKIYPKRPYGGVWDNIKREPKIMSIFEVRLER